MRISDWSSDGCSSDRLARELIGIGAGADQEKIGLRSVACVLCGASGPIITLGYRLRRTRCLGIALEHCHRIFRPFQLIIGGGASQPDKAGIVIPLTQGLVANVIAGGISAKIGGPNV